MAGRHRKPPAWRRLLTALSRRRHDAPRAAGAAAAATAALQTEVAALRETVAVLREQLAEARAAAVAAAAAPSPAAQWRVPLVKDLPTVEQSIVLPERPMLDPRLARAAELVDELFAGRGEEPRPAASAPSPAPREAAPAVAEESRPAA